MSAIKPSDSSFISAFQNAYEKVKPIFINAAKITTLAVIILSPALIVKVTFSLALRVLNSNLGPAVVNIHPLLGIAVLIGIVAIPAITCSAYAVGAAHVFNSTAKYFYPA